MSEYLVEGGKALEGEVTCKGAKNSCLPILSASLLCPEVHLYNVPCLTDVESALEILKFLGSDCKRQGSELIIKNNGLENIPIGKFLSSRMRSSVLFAGSLLSLFKECDVAFPGGCSLGSRPVDLHIKAFKALGCEVSTEGGSIRAFSKGRNLKGIRIVLPFPSVGATENIILASIFAEGETDILLPAKEPEINDLCAFLNKAGAKVYSGSDFIHIEGVDKLRKVSYRIMPDRIEAVSYMAFAAGNSGKISINSCCPKHFEAVSSIFRAMGCYVEENEDNVYLSAPKRLKAVSLRTMPYPFFPTDAQPLISSLAIRAEGISKIEETIFSERFNALEEFKKLGALIKTDGQTAVIKGTEKLRGADMKALDLRGGAALISASLQAEGISRITDISHIERGYDGLEGNLQALGASLKKIQGE